jgi:hypothetical protein
MTYRNYAATRTVLSTETDTEITVRGEMGRAPGQPQTMLATVDFGDFETDSARTRVTNFTWHRDPDTGDVPRPVCHVVGRPSRSGVDDEEALILGIRAIVTNVVDGVSFDIIAFAPDGATGLFEVHIKGE